MSNEQIQILEARLRRSGLYTPIQIAEAVRRELDIAHAGHQSAGIWPMSCERCVRSLSPLPF